MPEKFTVQLCVFRTVFNDLDRSTKLKSICYIDKDDLLATLRQSDWAMPVILITAFGDEETHCEAKRLGTAILLDKPFDIMDLLHAARSIVPPTI